MKYGVNTFIWTESFSEENLSLLPRIKKAGFDGIEVFMFDLSQFQTTVIRRGLEENGLEATICAIVGQDFSLISGDAAVRRNALEQLKAFVKTAAEVGAKVISGPLYSPVGFLPGRRRTVDEWRWCVDCYQQLGPTLAEYDISVGIEPLNRFETYFLNTAADAAMLCREINHSHVGVLFDTFHANIEEKDIAQGYRTVGPYLKHVHTCENDRGTPGSGHIEWRSVFAALRDIGYDGWLTIESFGFALPNISGAAAIWRDLAASPDEIPFEGVKFLRQNAASAASA
jgi:D-psicose/D-tagatose/L-ribulose 3-epimerase